MYNSKEYLGKYRREYDRELPFTRENLPEDPLFLFNVWLEDAIRENIADANAMLLSTVDREGQPSARVVLLRNAGENGFVFFTNYQSSKAKQVEDNPKVALNFYWFPFNRQVIVKGIIEKVPEEVSDEYFYTRPYESRLGAWASPQSEPIDNRKVLEDKMAELKQKFPKDVPRPLFWGGYAVQPESIEFWQGRPNRLHDRFLFEKTAQGNWDIKRLAP